MPLCAQNSEWRKFRASQTRIRHRFRNESFSKFEDEVRERRRRYQLSGDVRLTLDSKQQSQLENWIEFQNYHLERLERFEKKIGGLKKGLNEARKKVENADTADLERAVEKAEVAQQILENTEWERERHKVLLQWIEQERWAMDSGYPTPIQEDVQDDKNDQNAASKAVPRIPTCARQKRRPKTSDVLGKVRIVKTRKLKASEFKPAIQEQTRSSNRAHLDRRPVPQQPQLTPENFIARNGRRSRPPVQWI